MNRGLVLSFILVASASASADTRVLHRVIEQERGDSVNEDTEDLVQLHPHTDMIVPAQHNFAPASVTSNTIYLNKCTGGCLVTRGPDDARTNRSSIVNSGGTLPAFPYSADAWNQVLACVQGTFAPFMVNVTDVKPTSSDYLAVLVGNNAPSAFGFGTGTGGVAPFDCEPYVSDALVFDFAGIWGQGTTCDTQCVVNICATAAQEIAHTWSLDHEIDSTDPMTYYGQNVPTPRHYKNASVQCGSDCVGGKGPNGETCSGAPAQNHACSCTGAQTQNSFATVKGLFGAAPLTPPTVTIQDPLPNAKVVAGFPIHSTVTDIDGVAQVVLAIDNATITTLTTGPFFFNAPATLTDGTHHVTITGTDVYGAMASASVDVVIGGGCSGPSDCPNSGDTCVGGACVAGSGVAGGLGATCTDSSQCLEGQCASGDMGMVCVVPCTTGQCPSGYGCVTATGAMAGVCYPGFDDGSGGGGCLDVSGVSGGSAGGLIFAALLVARRRRKK